MILSNSNIIMADWVGKKKERNTWYKFITVSVNFSALYFECSLKLNGNKLEKI